MFCFGLFMSPPSILRCGAKSGWKLKWGGDNCPSVEDAMPFEDSSEVGGLSASFHTYGDNGLKEFGDNGDRGTDLGDDIDDDIADFGDNGDRGTDLGDEIGDDVNDSNGGECIGGE